MVVVGDDLLLMRYWVPEALAGLQALVEDVLPRVRHMPAVSRLGSSSSNSSSIFGSGGVGGSKDGVQQLRAAANKLPGRLYSLVLAMTRQVRAAGSSIRVEKGRQGGGGGGSDGLRLFAAGACASPSGMISGPGEIQSGLQCRGASGPRQPCYRECWGCWGACWKTTYCPDGGAPLLVIHIP